ncbi:MAG: FkbM family methyltransferase [Ignavibacteriaceae bacterium]
MKTDFFRQLILDKILSLKSNSGFEKLLFKILLLLNNKFGNENDLVKYNLDGHDIILLSSHELPILRKFHPQYSENIGRITKYLKDKYDGLKVIDIGANAGDTVYIIKSYCDVPILCIEGNQKYFLLLQENIKYWDDVFAEKTFIGNADFGNADYVFSKGSGNITKTSKVNPDIVFEELTTVLERNNNFKDFKFIKIDTDGFDCRIIKNEINLIDSAKPVVFFEYDPYLFHTADDNGFSVFASLKQAGYNKLLVYDNIGDYLLTTSMNDEKMLEDIHHFFSGRQKEKYCDLCAFHDDDTDLAEEIRKKELSFFREFRK